MLGWLKTILGLDPQAVDIVPELEVTRIGSYADYMRYIDRHEKVRMERIAYEKKLIPVVPHEFFLDAFCYVCNKQVKLKVDFLYCHEEGRVKIPNWRERLVCPSCTLNNRVRATLHIFEQECLPGEYSSIYN